MQRPTLNTAAPAVLAATVNWSFNAPSAPRRSWATASAACVTDSSSLTTPSCWVLTYSVAPVAGAESICFAVPPADAEAVMPATLEVSRVASRSATCAASAAPASSAVPAAVDASGSAMLVAADFSADPTHNCCRPVLATMYRGSGSVSDHEGPLGMAWGVKAQLVRSAAWLPTLQMLTCSRSTARGLQHEIGVIVAVRENRLVVIAARVAARVEVLLLVACGIAGPRDSHIAHDSSDSLRRTITNLQGLGTHCGGGIPVEHAFCSTRDTPTHLFS